jgi:hypothetical protein
VDSYSKAEPQEQRSLTLYTLASRLQKQKARSNPYMVIFNFIDYFILMLHDFPLLSTTWPSSCSNFSGFISLLCHRYFPATFSGLRPRLFSSDPPPYYKGTFLSWGSCTCFVQHWILICKQGSKYKVNAAFWLHWPSNHIQHQSVDW